MAPESTVLSQSAVSEGGEIFPALLVHLMRQYTEVYGLAVDTAWVHELRELLLREREGLTAVPIA